MRVAPLFKRLVRLVGVRVVGVEVEDDERGPLLVVVQVELRKRRVLACSSCGQVMRAVYDHVERRWRHHGCGRLHWPHGGRLNWPHPPSVFQQFISHRGRACGRRGQPQAVPVVWATWTLSTRRRPSTGRCAAARRSAAVTA